MSKRGIEFLTKWLDDNVTQQIKDSVDGDAATLAIEFAEKAIADAAKAGLKLDDLEPEVLIREALDSSEGAPSD